MKGTISCQAVSMFCLLLAAGLASVQSLEARGEDYFLTIGGGSGPTGNQASLERNVILQRRVLRDLRPGVSHEVFFADGNAPERDVQVLNHDERDACPPAQRIMTEIFGDPAAVGLCYRDHQIDAVAGPNELRLVKRRFRELGRTLKAGDRIVIYVTGHGSPALGEYGEYGDYHYDEELEEWVEADENEDPPAPADDYNTSLMMWDDESVEAAEFARWLDRLPSDVSVVLVMVQCYSGGFAHAIFHQNDKALGLSKHARCGFFAQVHDRPAAGCTPDALDPESHEYSTFFWAALGGKTPAGEPIEPPDYNRDGNISFAEAHAYTVIASETIDIPVRTSEELLRHYSRLGDAPMSEDDKGDSGLAGIFKLLTAPPAADPELLPAAGPLAALLPQAKPEQRAILEQLPARLEMELPATVEDVQEALAQAADELEQTAGELSEATERLGSAHEELRNDVTAEWPELSLSFAPLAAELMADRAEEFVAFVEALPSYDAHLAARERQEELTDAYMEAMHREAALERLMRTIETVVLAVNLRQASPAEIVARYEQMIALEEQGLDAAAGQ